MLGAKPGQLVLLSDLPISVQAAQNFCVMQTLLAKPAHSKVLLSQDTSKLEFSCTIEEQEPKIEKLNQPLQYL